jgi:hypothetical protein
MCPGLRDETATVRPLPMCTECAHWQEHTGAVIRPHVVIVIRDGGQVLTCSRRVVAEPLPIES